MQTRIDDKLVTRAVSFFCCQESIEHLLRAALGAGIGGKGATGRQWTVRCSCSVVIVPTEARVPQKLLQNLVVRQLPVAEAGQIQLPGQQEGGNLLVLLLQ